MFKLALVIISVAAFVCVEARKIPDNGPSQYDPSLYDSDQGQFLNNDVATHHGSSYDQQYVEDDSRGHLGEDDLPARGSNDFYPVNLNQGQEPTADQRKVPGQVRTKILNGLKEVTKTLGSNARRVYKESKPALNQIGEGLAETYEHVKEDPRVQTMSNHVVTNFHKAKDIVQPSLRQGYQKTAKLFKDFKGGMKPKASKQAVQMEPMETVGPVDPTEQPKEDGQYH